MRCHVCGADMLTMDGWAWTLTAEGGFDVITCSNCTPGMRLRVGTEVAPGTPEYAGRVVVAVVNMREERRAAAFAAGGGAVRVWIDEALTPQERGKRKKTAFAALYGASDGELSKLMAGKLIEDGKPGPYTEAAVRQLQAALNAAIPFDESKLVEWAKQMMPKDKHHDSWATVCEHALSVVDDPKTRSAVASALAKAADAVETLSRVEKPVPPQQPFGYCAHESGKLPIIGEAPGKSENWTGGLMGKMDCSRYSPKQPPEVYHCAITGKPASEMRKVLGLWELWHCPGGVTCCICVDSPCGFEVRRRLGMDQNDAWAADGPWGKSFSREQVLAWMAHPPQEFLERTEKVLREVAELYGNQCPLQAAKKTCAHCGKPSITLFEKSAPVPLCGVCAQVADAADLPQAEKEEIVRRTAAGDRYAWQRLVEAGPLATLWSARAAMRTDERVVREMLAECDEAERRRFLKEHPGEHLVKVLGMADFFGPKVR